MAHEQNKRPRRRRRHSTGHSITFALFYIIFVIGSSVLLACFGWVLANDLLALNKPEHSAVITVGENDTFSDVVDQLKENDLIDYPFFFKLFGVLTKGEDKVSRGTYTLDSTMDYSALLSGLSPSGSTRAEVTITFPEGYTLDQTFALMVEKGVATLDELEDAAANYDYNFSFLKELPLGDPHRLEGYLYPDTYTFYTPNDPVYAINKLLVNFDARLTDEYRDEIVESGRTIHEILTIASMIEKETDGTDRTKIASVIENRLANPNAGTLGRLQIDATIYYVTGREVTQSDRETLDSPYNTHINKGLPPGPIANPGIQSILAAMNPEDTDYYYYALGDDNLHHFYKTYDSFINFLNSQERYQ